MKNQYFRMQSLFVLVAVTLLQNPYYSQDFVWKKGSNITNQSGIYGSLGTPSVSNNPGARSGSCSWKDGSGNFWLFGGEGRDFIGNSGRLNDLWKYNVNTNEWTWMSGDNIIDQIGNYGTMGLGSPINKPGCRTAASYWKDGSGNLWLFGGYGYDGSSSLGYLNDLWKYNISSNEWTWVGGSNTANQNSVYGTIAVPSTSNMPGARRGGASWADANGNFWMFGGLGFPTLNTLGRLNDMWKYSTTTNEWTWMSGSSNIDQNGTYGTQGTASTLNKPGGRQMSSHWTDNSGNFWLLGGEGFDSGVPLVGFLADFWKYNPLTSEWTWIRGGNVINQNGVYGTQGIANAANNPGARFGGVTWVDGIGAMWLFSGRGFGASGVNIGETSDLWSYNIINNEWTWIRNSSLLDQLGTYGSLGTPAPSNRPGGRHNAVSWMDASNNLWFFGGNGFASSGGSGDLNDLWKYANCFISPITMTIISNDSTICAGESTSLTASGSNNYIWSQNTATTSFLVINPNITTTYTVYTLDANGCKYSTSFTQTVNACAGIQQSSVNGIKSWVFPNPNNGTFAFKSVRTEKDCYLHIYNALGEMVLRKKITETNAVIESNLVKGIYFYELLVAEKKTSVGKIIVE